MIKFCKIYNGTVKRMYGLTRGTPNILIDEILGSWKPQTAIMQDTVRNINLWFSIFGGNLNYKFNDR